MNAAHRARLALTSLGLVLLYGCSGGLSCGGSSSCLNGYDYPQTQAAVPNGVQAVDDGVRLRLTQDALDFLAVNLRPLLLRSFPPDPEHPERVVLPLPPVNLIGNNLTLGQGDAETRPSKLTIDTEELGNSLTFELVGDDAGEPKGIRVRAVDVPLGFEGRAFGDFGLGNAACDVTGTNPLYGGAPFLTGVTFEAIVKPDVGRGSQCRTGEGECLLISVDVVEVNVAPRGSLDGSVLSVSKPPICSDTNGPGDGDGPCSEDCSDTFGFFDPLPKDAECTTVCSVANLGVDLALSIVGFFEPLMRGLLQNALEGAVTSALDDFNRSPLSMSSRLALSKLLPGVISASALDLGYSVSPTGDAFDVNCPAGSCRHARGIDLIMKTGFEAAPPLDGDDTRLPHPCVNALSGAPFAALYGGAEFQTPDAAPLTGLYNGTPYHLGASLAAPALNQALFAAYNSGALCIEMTSDGLHALTGGAFPLSAGTLDLLTEGKLRQFASTDAPAVVALTPTQPPVIKYGSGVDAEGHILVEWPNVEVSFYVLTFERFARVFSVSANVSAGLSVFNDPIDNTLHIAVVDGPNIDGFTQTYNELLPGVNFSEVLESLVGVAFDAALGDGINISYDVAGALATALNVPIFVDFAGLETLPNTGERDFLNVYLSLASERPHRRVVRAMGLHVASEPGIYQANEAELVVTPRPTGEVRIEGDAGLDRALEYFARVDFGAWRGPLRVGDDGNLLVRDGKLSLIGEHVITLRARRIGEPSSLEDEGTELRIWVDPEPPTAALAIAGDSLVATGTDIGTDAQDLLWSWQRDDEAFSAFTTTAVRDLDELDGARRVSVRAQDRAGNVSKVATVDLAHARRVDTEASSALSCAQSTADGAALAIGMLLVLSFAALTRRRRARASVVLVARRRS